MSHTITMQDSLYIHALCNLIPVYPNSVPRSDLEQALEINSSTLDYLLSQIPRGVMKVYIPKSKFSRYCFYDLESKERAINSVYNFKENTYENK